MNGADLPREVFDRLFWALPDDPVSREHVIKAIEPVVAQLVADARAEGAGEALLTAANSSRELSRTRLRARDPAGQAVVTNPRASLTEPELDQVRHALAGHRPGASWESVCELADLLAPTVAAIAESRAARPAATGTGASAAGWWVDATICVARHDVDEDGVLATWWCQLPLPHDQHADSAGRRWPA